jgi:hypothetical protein
LSGVYLDGELIRGVRHRTGDLVASGDGHKTIRADGDASALRQVTGSSDIKLILDGFTRSKNRQGVLSEPLGSEPLLDTLERQFRCCTTLVSAGK